MLEAMKCPACSAALEAPKDGSPLLRCPYCNMVIARDGTSTDAPQGPAVTPSPLPPVSLGLKIGCLLALVIVFAIPLIIIMLAHRTAKEIRNTAPQIVTPAIPTRIEITVPTPPIPVPPPQPPSFARMVQEFGAEGVGPGRFQDAESIALDGLGHIYVGEFSGGRVQVFDLQGKYLAGWNTGSVKSLQALAADRKGTVYAAVAPQILRFEAMTGKPLGPLDDMNTDVEEFYRDVFCTVDGDVYAIGGNSHIVQFDADGKIKNTIRADDKVGEAVELQRVLVQPGGEIYALDKERGVFKFASDGHYVNRFGGGQGKERLSSPRCLASDGKGRIYVSDEGPAIFVFDPDGGFLDTFGTNQGAFGLAISDNNEIYASFADLHAIRKFVLEKP
jgi:outer membrane protein assembly factor BamB